MVAAAHLRPLEKKDKISEGKLQQPWNTLATTPSSDGKREAKLTHETEEVSGRLTSWKQDGIK